MILETVCRQLKKFRSTNSTDASFPTRIPTTTEPVGIGDAAAQTTSAVVPLTDKNGGQMANSILLLPFGTGNDADTCKLRVIGWRVAGLETAASTPPLWIPVPLAELTATLSTPVGVAGAYLIATERFADTLTLDLGNSNVSAEILSNGTNFVAHAIIDLKGFQKVEVTFDRNSSATAANALYALIN